MKDEIEALLHDAGAVEIDVRSEGDAWIVGAAFPFDDGAGGYPHGKPYWGSTARPGAWESPLHLAQHIVDQYRSDIARFALAPAPEEADDAGHEAHGETGASVEAGPADGDGSGVRGGGGEAGEGEPPLAGELGLRHGAEESGRGDEAQADPDFLDADFQELAALSYEDTPAEAAPPEQSGGVAIFGDNFATMRLAKMGRLAQIAAEKSAAAFAAVGWTDDEYNAVQAHVVSNLAQSTGAYTGGQQAIYDRFMAMEAAKQRVNGFRVHRDQCTDYLNAADTPRVMVEQFDPDAGWPG